MVGMDGQEGAESVAPNSDAVLAGLKALQDPFPDRAEGDTLEEGSTLDGEGRTSDGSAPVEPQAAGILSFLDPRAAIRLASVYQMKDRAGTVGWNGVARLLEAILKRTNAPVHAVGHSYGGKVILSAIAAASLPRKVATVLLLQPAVSHLSFAKQVPGREGEGGYSGVPAKVSRPILTTYSSYDLPLHDVFHRALIRGIDLGDLRIAGGDTSAGAPPNAYAALGGYGPRDADERLFDYLPDPGQTLDVPDGPGIIGLDGTVQRRITGHGDVTTPATAWLLYLQLVR